VFFTYCQPKVQGIQGLRDVRLTVLTAVHHVSNEYSNDLLNDLVLTMAACLNRDIQVALASLQFDLGVHLGAALY
jgi:hypothetical protein